MIDVGSRMRAVAPFLIQGIPAWASGGDQPPQRRSTLPGPSSPEFDAKTCTLTSQAVLELLDLVTAWAVQPANHVTAAVREWSHNVSRPSVAHPELPSEGTNTVQEAHLSCSDWSRSRLFSARSRLVMAIS